MRVILCGQRVIAQCLASEPKFSCEAWDMLRGGDREELGCSLSCPVEFDLIRLTLCDGEVGNVVGISSRDLELNESKVPLG